MNLRVNWKGQSAKTVLFSLFTVIFMTADFRFFSTKTFVSSPIFVGKTRKISIMARLYINKCITKERDKLMNWWFTGEDGISYNDVNEFISKIPATDNRIDVELYSCGGDCTEGFAIYDALRTCGKELTTCVVGECASMATIIALAAPEKERRAYKHARFLIHEPYYPDGIYGAIDIQKLETLKSSLDTDRQKLKDIYVERTGQSEKDIEAQMTEGNWFDTEKALELGFIAEIMPETSAIAGNEPRKSTTTRDSINKINNNSMTQETKKEPNAIAKALNVIACALGLGDRDEQPNTVALQLTAQDGTVINVERDEGDIQVGDVAQPDGTFTLEDGRIITIQDGVITAIQEGETPNEGEEPEEDLTAKIDELSKRVEELEKQLSDANAKVKTEEEITILDAVNKLGGIEVLKNIEIGKIQIPEKPVDNTLQKQSLIDARAEYLAKSKK